MGRKRRLLNDTTDKMLDFIKDYSDEKGITPSVREIMAGCDIGSTNTVVWNLDKLEDAGYLTRYRRIARGIVLKAD